MEDELGKISPPLYLIGKKINCWKCEERMSVVALLAPKVEGAQGEVCILTGIVKLPHCILEFIQKRVPSFRSAYSRTAGERYFANTCPSCGIISGDFYLQAEPGGAFFPNTEEEAGSLYMTEIPVSGSLDFECGFGMGIGGMILEHAKKID